MPIEEESLARGKTIKLEDLSVPKSFSKKQLGGFSDYTFNYVKATFDLVDDITSAFNHLHEQIAELRKLRRQYMQYLLEHNLIKIDDHDDN